MLQSLNIKIQHEKFGVLLDETFGNTGQFKLFLKLVQGCLEMKEDLTFFNGNEFLIHVPHSYLINSIITTKVDNYSMAEHLVKKSKLEAQEIK
jgi:hypothetical protein